MNGERKSATDSFIETARLRSEQSDVNRNGVPDENSCGRCHKGQGNRRARWIQCDECTVWFHISCVGVSVQQYEHLGAPSNTDKWYCKGCRTSGQMDPNRLTWGLYGDENEVKDV